MGLSPGHDEPGGVRYAAPMDPPCTSSSPAKCPTGKYKGRVIADLPGNYLAWFARGGLSAGRVGPVLALMLEIDHKGLKHLLSPLRRPSI